MELAAYELETIVFEEDTTVVQEHDCEAERCEENAIPERCPLYQLWLSPPAVLLS